MKKSLFIAIIILLFATLTYATSVTVLVSSSPPAGGTWSSSIVPGGLPGYANIRSGDGFLNVSINSGAAWVATVTLQRTCIDPNSVSSWCDVAQYTTNTEKALIDQQEGIYYRIGIKNGQYTSGTIRATLTNALPD